MLSSLGDRYRILIFGFVHFLVATAFLLWSIGWQMWLLDSGKDSAQLPFGFYVVFSIDLLLGLPLRLPISVAVSHFGMSDSIFNNIYCFFSLTVINSLAAAMIFGYVLRLRRINRSVTQSLVN